MSDFRAPAPDPEELDREGLLARIASLEATLRASGDGSLAREVLDRVADGFYAVDRDWRIRYVNQRTAELWGRTREELVGRTLWELFPDAENTEGYRMHQLAARTGKPVAFDTFSPNLRGWVEARIYPGPAGLSVYFRDASERKRIEESLRESETRLAQALAAAEIGTTRFLVPDQVYHFDERAREMLGFQRSRVARDVVEGQVHPEDLDEFRAVRERAVRPGGRDEFHHSFRFLRPDGLERWFRVHARVLFEEESGSRRPVAAVGVFLDVTDQVAAERELLASKETAERARDAAETAREQAEQASRAKDHFLSSISHELRTPLSAVIGYAELLETQFRGPLNDVQLEYLARIKASARHQAAIIDEILTFSRTEAGKEVARPKDVDLAAVCREVVEMLGLRIEAGGVNVLLVGADAPVPAYTDPGKVRQILVNLVGNALKYTEQGHVEVTMEAGDDQVGFRVHDTGPGIPPDRLEDIFLPFTQLDQSPTRSKGGTGLGLTICRRLTELLGGTITVDSCPGNGSTFTVRLPRHLPSTPATVVRTPRSVEAEASRTGSETRGAP
jgi:PAS domain S-box-containing protein